MAQYIKYKGAYLKAQGSEFNTQDPWTGKREPTSLTSTMEFHYAHTQTQKEKQHKIILI